MAVFQLRREGGSGAIPDLDRMRRARPISAGAMSIDAEPPHPGTPSHDADRHQSAEPPSNWPGVEGPVSNGVVVAARRDIKLYSLDEVQVRVPAWWTDRRARRRTGTTGDGRPFEVSPGEKLYIEVGPNGSFIADR
jgi:hypothetical protein